ncbi:MAG: methionyl-tRNA formyltransferase [Nitrospiria bacterium]
MRVIFMGTPDFAVSTLVALAESGEEIIGVVTQPDRPKGRQQLLTPSPVKVTAEKYRFPIYQPLKVKDPSFIQMVKDLSPDLIAVVAFGQILPKALLDIPGHGCVNVHASLLPAYRGAAPIQWAMIQGEKFTGVTTMLMDPGMDTGPILRPASIPIEPDDTFVTLSAKLSELGAKTLIDTLKGLKEGTIQPVPQDSQRATYAPLLKKEDGLIRWTEPAEMIERKTRALTLWPGMFTYFNNGKMLKVLKAEVQMEAAKGLPGEVVSTGEGRLVVTTGGGALSLLEIQPENSKRMTAVQFLAGHDLKKGDYLGPLNGTKE